MRSEKSESLVAVEVRRVSRRGVANGAQAWLDVVARIVAKVVLVQAQS